MVEISADLDAVDEDAFDRIIENEKAKKKNERKNQSAQKEAEKDMILIEQNDD